jgi:hypothetical protein
MGIAGRVRKILLAKGSSYISPILGLAMFIVFAVFPWIMASPGAITLMEHYVEFGKTSGWPDLMIRHGQVDAALAFSTALILLPFAFLFAFRNRPVASGLLSITSGLLLIYMFKVTETTITLHSLIREWREMIGFFPPYNIGPSPYAIIFMGFLFIFGHYYSKRNEPKEAAA